MAPASSNDHGFTLIEVALLMVVVGLVIAVAFPIIGRTRDAKAAPLTDQRMIQIQKALVVYAIQNGCIPCPADGTVTDNNAGKPRDLVTGTYPGTCTTDACIDTNAVVPWKALGLSMQDATDAWNDMIRYRVFSITIGALGHPECVRPLVQASGGMQQDHSNYPCGALTIRNNDTVTDDITVAAFALISSGPDRSLAIQTSGLITADKYGQLGSGGGQDLNAGIGTTIAQGNISTIGGVAHFDDRVLFMTAANLVQQCGSNACGNP